MVEPHKVKCRSAVTRFVPGHHKAYNKRGSHDLLGIAMFAKSQLIFFATVGLLLPIPSAVAQIVYVPPRKPAKPAPGSVLSRLEPHREKALRDWGGTKESEAAVDRGLKWLASIQEPDGSWKMDGKFPDKGMPSDIAGAAFGLLPFLGRGFTHADKKDNPYAATVAKGIEFLCKSQDTKGDSFQANPYKGKFSKDGRCDMYAQALATLALAEAYGLVFDDPLINDRDRAVARNLREPAQMAANYIIVAQHTRGGWRYSPGQPGDTSVTGWQVAALTIRWSRRGHLLLDVPGITLRKASKFLESCNKKDGFSYMAGSAPNPTMTAVGLLCHLQLQRTLPGDHWLSKGIETYIKPQPPGTLKNIEYDYHATQVMRHASPEDWKSWNAKMRDHLVRTQDTTDGPLNGSWSAKGDLHEEAGGRLMMTSLCLLTLEVYYRYVPFFEPRDK